MTPIRTDSAAVFKEDAWLKASHSHISKFGDQFQTYYEKDGFIYTPRNMYQVATDDQREAGDRVDFAHVFTPRNSDQENVIDDCLMRLRRGENFILEAPTGWGKTYVCVAIIAAMGRRALVIVTKDDIVKQWANAVNTIIKDCRIGYWRGDTVPKRDDQIVIGLVQSLRKGQERYPAELFKGFGFVVVDEAHRMGADEFSQSMWHFPAKLRLGLTATPDRKDGKEMVFKGHIGPVQVKAKMDVLSFGVLAVATSWNLYQYEGGIRTVPAQTRARDRAAEVPAKKP